MATSPLVADGRYAWLDGTPENDVISFGPNGPEIVTTPQAGMVYEVVIKSGRVHEVVICPADFDAFNAAKDIPGKMYSRVYRDSDIENYNPNDEMCLHHVQEYVPPRLPIAGGATLPDLP